MNPPFFTCLSYAGVRSLEEYVASYSLGTPLEDTEADMVILWMQLPREIIHRQEEEKEKEDSDDSSLEGTSDQEIIALEWTDALLRCLDSTPGFRDTVLTTLVVTPPSPPPVKTDTDSTRPGVLTQPLAQEQIELSVSTTDSGEKVVLHRPLQSYQFSGMNKIEVDASRPAVVVHRLPGVVRYAHFLFQI